MFLLNSVIGRAISNKHEDFYPPQEEIISTVDEESLMCDNQRPIRTESPLLVVYSNLTMMNDICGRCFEGFFHFTVRMTEGQKQRAHFLTLGAEQHHSIL